MYYYGPFAIDPTSGYVYPVYPGWMTGMYFSPFTPPFFYQESYDGSFAMPFNFPTSTTPTIPSEFNAYKNYPSFEQSMNDAFVPHYSQSVPQGSATINAFSKAEATTFSSYDMSVEFPPSDPSSNIPVPVSSNTSFNNTSSQQAMTGIFVPQAFQGTPPGFAPLPPITTEINMSSKINEIYRDEQITEYFDKENTKPWHQNEIKISEPLLLTSLCDTGKTIENDKNKDKNIIFSNLSTDTSLPQNLNVELHPNLAESVATIGTTFPKLSPDAQTQNIVDPKMIPNSQVSLAPTLLQSKKNPSLMLSDEDISSLNDKEMLTSGMLEICLYTAFAENKNVKILSIYESKSFLCTPNSVYNAKLVQDVLNCNVLVIPMHEHLHYFLIVLDLQSKIVYFMNSGNSMSIDRKNVLEYFIESMKRYSLHSDNARIVVGHNWSLSPLNSARQSDSYNCGIYVVHNAIFIVNCIQNGMEHFKTVDSLNCHNKRIELQKMIKSDFHEYKSDSHTETSIERQKSNKNNSETLSAMPYFFSSDFDSPMSQEISVNKNKTCMATEFADRNNRQLNFKMSEFWYSGISFNWTREQLNEYLNPINKKLYQYNEGHMN